MQYENVDVSYGVVNWTQCLNNARQELCHGLEPSSFVASASVPLVCTLALLVIFSHAA